LPARAAQHEHRRRRHRGRHARHVAQRCRQPGPAPFRVPARVPRRPSQRPGAHRVRPGCALVPRWPARACRGPGEPGTDPRAHARHPPVGRAPRADRCPALRLRTDLGVARAHAPAPRVRTGRRHPVSRVAVVTGGASGIGLGVARHLAAAGHHVAVLDRDGAGAESAVAALRDGGATAVACVADVADWSAVDRAFAAVRAALGPVEILVTSAGIESFDPLDSITPERWRQIVDVNLTGTFACAQAGVADMRAAGWGRIVTIASSSAQSGAPNMAHYAASKGGVIALTKALAVELARSGITANTIAPSLVDTPMARAAEAAGDFPGVDVIAPMVPLGRAGTPDDIAAMAAFLCSDAGSYITGQ